MTLLERFGVFARDAFPPWFTAGERRHCERAYVAGAADVLAVVDALTQVDALVRGDDPAWAELGTLADQVAAYRAAEGLPAPARRQGKRR